MKYRLFGFFLISVILLFGCANSEETSTDPVMKEPFYNFDYASYQVEFGMKEGDLIEMFGEGNEAEQGDLRILSYDYDNITGKCSYNGNPYVIAYGFNAENSLIAIICGIYPNEEDPKLTKVLYAEIDQYLTKQFGQPIASGEKWYDERYKTDEIMFEKAVSEGDYQKIAVWQLPDKYAILNVEESTLMYTTNSADVLHAQDLINNVNQQYDFLPASYPIEVLPFCDIKRDLVSKETENGSTVSYESNASYEDVVNYYDKLFLDIGGEYVKMNLDTNQLFLSTSSDDLDKSISASISTKTNVDGVITNNPVITIVISQKSVYDECKRTPGATLIKN